jgi:hypothetical protein
MKNDVKVNIEPDVKELVIRNGEAPILYPPNKIEFEGLITTPIDYFISRKGQKPDYFDLSKTLVVVEISKGIITLFGNPSDGFGDKITGRLHINPVLGDFGLVDGGNNRYGSPSDLAEIFRRNLRFFISPEEGRRLIYELKHLKVNTNGKVERTNDDRGSKKTNFEQAVESNLPVDFMLKVPVFHGGDPVIFKVEVFLEVNGPSVACSLFSGELIDLIEKERDAVMNESVKSFENFGVTIIRK